jgi:hypothetical protein
MQEKRENEKSESNDAGLEIMGVGATVGPDVFT